MSWSAKALVSLLVSSAAVTLAHPSLTKRQSSRSDLVTGIDWRDANGNVPVRREVHDLRNNYPDQWNLYLMALREFMDKDQDDDTSFYAVAGIHGKPYKVWKDAPGIPSKIGRSGYCPHSNALFLSWHRPYVALYEQQLYKYVQDIALRAPPDQVDRYTAAADVFRVPYWDWARGSAGGGVPEFFTEKSILITDPSGRKSLMKNPLYSYDFKPVDHDKFENKWSRINSTVRWPATENWWEESRNEEFEKSFLELQRTYQDGVEMAFRRTSFNSFGQQIEEVHGWMHGTIGGGYTSDKGGQGHMWPLEYSGFEPLFWLHHTNVDRLFAMYQKQHPNSYLEPSNVGQNGNVFIEDGSTIDANTPLVPFRRTPGSFWTTTEVRDTTTFGYAYPETVSSDQADAKKKISRLYSGSTRQRLAPPATVDAMSEKVHTMLHENLQPNRTYTDWVITTSADPLSLPPTFVVRFSFVGDFSSDKPREAGMWSILMPMDHHETKRRDKRSKLEVPSEKFVNGTVLLTSTLLDEIAAGRLKSLSEDDVEPFLKDKLTWKVFSGNGTQLCREDMQAISIQVESCEAHIPENPDDPVTYSEETKCYPEIKLKDSAQYGS